MSVALDPAVIAALDAGRLVALPLVRFDLPGLNGGPVHSVGYHSGGRSYTHDGFEYLPNKFLNAGDMVLGLGNEVTTRKLTFSAIPSDDPDNAIAQFEQYDYINAPVIVSVLLGVPESNDPLGVLVTDIYEINDVVYPVGAADADGNRDFSIEVELEPVGRTIRDSVQIMRNLETQQFDNNPNDTSMKRLAVASVQPREWGQRV